MTMQRKETEHEQDNALVLYQWSGLDIRKCLKSYAIDVDKIDFNVS